MRISSNNYRLHVHNVVIFPLTLLLLVLLIVISTNNANNSVVLFIISPGSQIHYL